MRTFAVGDIHGAHRALVQVLNQSDFDYDHDQLICLGDVADGRPEVPECVDELLRIKHMIAIRGNHDMWCLDWITKGVRAPGWAEQGGRETMEAYIATGKLMDQSHRAFWEQQKPFHVDAQHRLYVHAGYHRDGPIALQSEYDLCWSRELYRTALQRKEEGFPMPPDVNSFKEVFIGHTPTGLDFPDLKPVQLFNIWNLDQGAKYTGKLTLMNVDTKEYWQSEIVDELYRGYRRPPDALSE